MNKLTTYLIDDIIQYSHDQKLSITQALTQLGALAQQRLPEYDMEKEQSSKEHALLDEIRKSKSHQLIYRTIMISWVHEVVIDYYPSYHVIDTPYELYAFPVSCNISNFPPESPKDCTYIDALFYDRDAGRFWQPEPYLAGNPIGAKIFKHIRSTRLVSLRGTHFRKINPSLINELLRVRARVPSYSIKSNDCDRMYFGSAYGSRGFRTRMKGVHMYWSRKRKSDWK